MKKLKKYQKEKLNECIAKIAVMLVDDIKPTDNFYNDYAMDSLDDIELIMDVEIEFEINIPDEKAENVKTVQDAYDLLATFL